MKALTLLKSSLLVSSLILTTFAGNAQLANWTFNGTLVGTGSATTSAGNAVLGSGITTGDYNGNLYYGEGGWPAGGIDMNAYLEFSITPVAGHMMTLANLGFNIRRSTTGTAAGSGPNNWTLRSSVDNYTSDLGTGTLALTSTTTVPVSLPAAFFNVSSKVTFRMYGYNAVVTTGGLSRFVYDNISINGSTILPVTVESFKAILSNSQTSLSWILSGGNEVASVTVERSTDGTSFLPIGEVPVSQATVEENYQYNDALTGVTGTNAYYRLKITAQDGSVSYSAVQVVTVNIVSQTELTRLRGVSGGNVEFTMNANQPGTYSFQLYNLNGNKITGLSIALEKGNESLSLPVLSAKPGIYVLVVEHGNDKTAKQFFIR